MGPRAVLRLTAIALLLLVCLPIWVVARLFGRDAIWSSYFLASFGYILGVRVTIEGAPVATHALYIANHISWLDILALGGATRARFIAKAEIAGWTLVGRLATMGGAVYVSRERRSTTRAQADAVAVALGGARPVVLFAEGGTGDGVTLAPFRPALFAAAVEARAPVQPVAIDYGPRAPDIAWPDGTRFATEMTRILSRRGRIPVTLRFAPPLDRAKLDRKELAIEAHRAIEARLTR